MRTLSYAPPREGLFTRPVWTGIVVVTIVLGLLPLLNVFTASDSALHISSYVIALIGKFMCYAIAALALDLVWGYTGILSLGHGMFFALGGYAHGMYLMRAIGREGAYQSDLPDFMVFLDWKAYPWYWSFTDHWWYVMLLVVLVPGLLAFVFGYFAFRSRIKGVYFSIITQALTFAAMLLFFRNATGFGGNNGFTDFKRILGFPITAPSTRAVLYLVTLAFLLASLVGARALMRSKFGRVLTAVRDAESRLMFVGYDQLWFKLFIWTLSAVLCGIAGALYVPQVGIINPSEMSPPNSIEMVIWVATGGRGTLIGPIIGAGVVNGMKTWLTTTFPEFWLYALGLVFVLVTLFLPQGIVGLFRKLANRKSLAAADAKANADLAAADAVGEPLMSNDVIGFQARVAGDAVDPANPGHGDGEIGYGRVATEGLDTRHGAILYLDAISVSFDGFKALNALTLDISVGELRCIIGPNGAGKTTMMDVITGKTRPDTGTVFFGQTIDLTKLSEPQIARAGIGRKFQRPTVFENHSVYENLELAMKTDKRVTPTLFARLTGEQRDAIDDMLELIRLQDSSARPAGLLSHGQKQWLEIGMLLIQEPQLLLLDEPVAGMTDAETARTAELLNELRGKHSMMVVEHDMDFVNAIAGDGKVTVLHEGSVLAEGKMADVQAHERVIEVYLGR